MDPDYGKGGEGKRYTERYLFLTSVKLLPLFLLLFPSLAYSSFGCVAQENDPPRTLRIHLTFFFFDVYWAPDSSLRNFHVAYISFT